MEQILSEWRAWLVIGGILGSAGLVGFLVYSAAMLIGLRVARRTPFDADELVLRRCAAPLGVVLPLLFVLLALPAAVPEPGLARPLLASALIFAFAWALVRVVGAAEEVALKRLDIGARDNLRARKLHTQLGILRRIAFVAIGILTAGVVLMNFEPLRRLGAGLLASAGVAGLVAGFAARRTLENLVAGVQIAFAQPIRLDDVVIVENEWGWIEEVTLTYVVVRIWDLRRLVVPLSYFIDHPFQNWTRTSADLLGTVMLHCDYTVPIDEVRNELERIVKASEHWDGKVWRLHVVEAGERDITLRALMSAADSPTAWELRCEVREKLIDFLRREHPECLPRVRAELREPDAPGAPG